MDDNEDDSVAAVTQHSLLSTSSMDDSMVATEHHHHHQRQHHHHHKHRQRHRLIDSDGRHTFQRRVRNGPARKDTLHGNGQNSHGTGGGKHLGKGATGNEQQRHKSHWFGTNNSTEVITQVGAVAHLPCVVLPIGAGVVSIIIISAQHIIIAEQLFYFYPFHLAQFSRDN